MAESAKIAGGGLTEIVSFVLDGKEYGLKIDFVKEVIRYRKITRVPGAPDYIRGVINLRGNIVPVMDLRLKLLDLRTDSQDVDIMICDSEGNMFGIIVDDVQEVVRLGADEIEKMGGGEAERESKVIDGVGKRENRLISILRINELLNWVDHTTDGA